MSEIPARVKEATGRVLDNLRELGLSDSYEEEQISQELYEKFLRKDSWGWTAQDLVEYWKQHKLN
jgi:hypothetical protein